MTDGAIFGLEEVDGEDTVVRLRVAGVRFRHTGPVKKTRFAKLAAIKADSKASSLADLVAHLHSNVP